MKQFHHTVFAHLKNGWERHGKTIIISSSATTITVLLLAGGLFAYASAYDEKIYPNVTVNGVNVGGLTKAEAAAQLDAKFQEMLGAGLEVNVENETATIDLRNSGATDPDLIFDLAYFDPQGAATSAYHISRTGNFIADQAYSVWLLISPLSYNMEVTLLTEQLEDSVRAKFPDLEEEGKHADYIVEESGDEYEVTFSEAEPGKAFVFPWANVLADAGDLHVTTMNVVLAVEDDMIEEDEALALTDDVIDAIENAPYTLTFIAEDTREYSWTIDSDDLLEGLMPERNDQNELVVVLNPDAFEELFEDIHDDVDVKPVDARFEMRDGKVTEFAGHQNGVAFNEEETLLLFNDQLGSEEVELAIVVETTEPEITTDNINDLGIREVLGVGISDFSGSPANRIANIKHGADKLNGLLIPPGETLSLVEQLKPFTIADGYLPELVILGDEIKPEVGGGLCQIGTTTFRATMNAGLEIVSRRNHSLVVSYYDDPSNGNPGTDATIYDPAPDYVMRNNTDNYILLTTVVDTSRMELVFTFWGTSDGRQGSYTPPEVLSWSGYGATQYKETTSLAPGVTRCQAPHAGATTTFDYTVEYADGTTHEETFNSTYRSLPRICLVGVGTVGAGETDGDGNYVGPADDDTDDSGDVGDAETPAEPADTAPELEVEDVPAETE